MHGEMVSRLAGARITLPTSMEYEGGEGGNLTRHSGRIG
jgi:hypothetical protein